ncbi:MAG: trypsin-like peptidase domain-containing protein, partial [Candidatus Levybacteria bacterium]|nr:trypsin-like peptidase domain-containing protein [Candidatus Levybacteria bacterium]
MRRLIGLVIILVIFLFVFSYLGDKFDLKVSPKSEEKIVEEDRIRVQSEESVVIDTVKKVGPSVITIVEDLPAQTQESFSFGPFSIFGFDGPTTTDPKPRNIGSGFVVSADGLIVTNKHVVSDASAKYQVLTSSDKSYNVEKIYRDPLNDIAILKVNASGLKPVEFGDSTN